MKRSKANGFFFKISIQKLKSILTIIPIRLANVFEAPKTTPEYVAAMSPYVTKKPPPLLNPLYFEENQNYLIN